MVLREVELGLRREEEEVLEELLVVRELLFVELVASWLQRKTRLGMFQIILVSLEHGVVELLAAAAAKRTLGPAEAIEAKGLLLQFQGKAVGLQLKGLCHSFALVLQLALQGRLVQRALGLGLVLGRIGLAPALVLLAQIDHDFERMPLRHSNLLQFPLLHLYILSAVHRSTYKLSMPFY